jgi:hypothetical protein
MKLGLRRRSHSSVHTPGELARDARGYMCIIIINRSYHVAVAMLTGLELMQRSVDVRRLAAKAENVMAGNSQRQQVEN